MELCIYCLCDGQYTFSRMSRTTSDCGTCCSVIDNLLSLVLSKRIMAGHSQRHYRVFSSTNLPGSYRTVTRQSFTFRSRRGGKLPKKNQQILPIAHILFHSSSSSFQGSACSFHTVRQTHVPKNTSSKSHVSLSESNVIPNVRSMTYSPLVSR
jgi:hypothetical protein